MDFEVFDQSGLAVSRDPGYQGWILNPTEDHRNLTEQFIPVSDQKIYRIVICGEDEVKTNPLKFALQVIKLKRLQLLFGVSFGIEEFAPENNLIGLVLQYFPYGSYDLICPWIAVIIGVEVEYVFFPICRRPVLGKRLAEDW